MICCDHYHYKDLAYEGSTHVPFIVRFPQHWDRRHQVRNELVELRDIMPTLCGAAGVDILIQWTDKAFAVASGETTDWRDHLQGEHTVSYGLEWGNQWVTDGRHKYVWFHHTGREFFFDLEQDPGECRNLINDPAYAERIDLLRRRLAEINERRGDPRGQDGKLVPQPQGALRLSPYYEKWKRRAEEIDHGAQP